MSRVGKRAIGIIVGIMLFIGVEEVRSRWGSPAVSQENVTQEDADLYLRVMRATADRVKNPTPEDLRTIDDFSRIKNVPTASARDLNDAERETVMKAIRITSTLDEVVANELQVDRGRYERVKDVVDSALPAPEDDKAGISPELTVAERTALESKGKAIASYADEIKQLYATVYSNPLRKTVRGN
jgi:hypothetical protein